MAVLGTTMNANQIQGKRGRSRSAIVARAAFVLGRPAIIEGSRMSVNDEGGPASEPSEGVFASCGGALAAFDY